MTTVNPPPPSQPPPPPSTSLPTVVVTSPPRALLEATLGLRLEALVLSTGGKGQIQVQTQMGQLSLETALPLPKGAQLWVALQSLSPQVQLQILTVDGNPAQQVLPHFGVAFGGKAQVPASGAGGAHAAGPTQGPGGLPFVTLTTGANIAATLVKPAPGLLVAGTGTGEGPAMRSSGVAGSGQMGANALGLMKSVWTSTKVQIFDMVGSVTGRGGGGQQGVASPPGQAAASGSSLVPGTQMNVRIVSIQAPTPGGGTPVYVTPAPSPVVLSSGQPIMGIVTGTTVAGQPVISTVAGNLTLATRTPVPQGTQLTFEIRGMPVTPADTGQAWPAALRGDVMMSREWPALKEALEVLQDANPAVAQQVLNTVIPRPDATLSSTLLFFMVALRGGDVRGWLGESALRILERTRPALAGLIKEDFGARVRLADESGRGDWKILAIPIQNEDGIEQIRFMTRRHREDEDPGEGGGTRFVVDVELTKLGRMQLDGLVRAKGKTLDLIVRTEMPLVPNMRDDIRGIFKEAAELTGIQGGVGFQAQPPGFVEIVVGDEPGDHGLVV